MVFISLTWKQDMDKVTKQYKILNKTDNNYPIFFIA